MLDKLAPKHAVLLAALILFVHSARSQPASQYDALVQNANTQLQAGNAQEALELGRQAVRSDASRWEAYAVAGGALMNLKRYEEATDSFSKAIDKAPENKQARLRDLRKQCVMAEAGVATSASGVNQVPASSPAQTTTQAEVVLWKSIENSKSRSDFQSYLNQYPNGAFVGLAHTHLDQLDADDKALQERQAADQARQAAETQRAYAAGVSYKDFEHHDALVTASPNGFSFKPTNGKDEIDASCADLEWQVEPQKRHLLAVRIKSTGKKVVIQPDIDHNIYTDAFAEALSKYCGPQGATVRLWMSH